MILCEKGKDIMAHETTEKAHAATEKCLSAHYLKPDNWILIEETEFYLKIINKATGARKSVDKFTRLRE